VLLFFAETTAHAQRDIFTKLSNKVEGLSNSGSGSGGDSLRNRRKDQEYVKVIFHYFDSSRLYTFDSSIVDYSSRYPIPPTHLYLGNTGSATKSLLFAPPLFAGFDPGFHAYDVYKWKVHDVRFFNVAKPFTELSYSLASRAEQIIEVLHTQNIKPNWNASFNYRMINAPGTFRNQKTNHNNYLFTSWFQSRNKRYNNYFIILSNSLQAGENGGILTDQDYLHSPIYAGDRFTIPTEIGGQPSYGNSFFNSAIYTGNKYKETNYILRQQYDFGRKDSVVTDSTVTPLFYPRVRFEHTFTYGKYQYNYLDVPVSSNTQQNSPDSAYYKSHYNLELGPGDSVFLLDKWKEISNDFSIYQYPDAKNQEQFFKVGLQVQLLNGEVRTSTSLYNMIGHGEYRNHTKNGKWDINAFGQLHLAGNNSGDYHAYVSLMRLINPTVGSLLLGFENTNRTAPFIDNTQSKFYLDEPKSFGKENIVHLFGAIYQPKLDINLSADYYLVSNYLYVTDFYKLQQESSLFNVLRINASKTFSIGKRWKWHADVYLQQKAGAADLHIPAIFTRNRFGYEGTLGFPNLNIALGLELRYHTPYKADDYSPVLGKFFYQDAVTIDNLPRLDAYMNFRIKTFRAFLRLENLNTASVENGFGFTNNSFAAPNYPTPGLIVRLGIFWNFIN
jgi:hypothetical protein